MGRMAEGGPARTKLTAVVDAIAVALVTAGLAVLALRVWGGIGSWSDAVAVAAMLAAGYVMADLLTGFVHWFCDTFFDVATPVIGPALIAPFREHHRDPLVMTRHGFLELTGSSFRGLAPLLAAFMWLGGASPLALHAFVLAMSSGAVATNVLHRWAHDPAPPRPARALQRLGLILTPERHARHHAPPYAAAYCVTSGWLNPLCERLRLWTRAEAVLIALGLPASRGDRA
jgi:ubiquitin-conjugating enzyme E2 variant